MAKFLQFVTVILILQAPGFDAIVASNENLIYTQVFTGYKKELRPVCGDDAPVETKIGIAVRQIMDLDEPKQVLTLNLWIRMNWFDCRLQWNPANFGGVDSLIVPNSKLWIPDITLYDNAGVGIPGIKDYHLLFTSTGNVIYNFPTVLNSLCLMDVTYFPFDTQNCLLKFGSWAFHGFQVDVTNRSGTGDTANFMLNGEWNLLDIPVKRHVLLYSCCPEPYPDVTFQITLKRKPLFYMLNLLFPCILITAVAVLGFLLPPVSGEKISLEITVLLSLAVFLLIVSSSLPPTSETFPFIGVYFCLAILLVTLSTVLSTLVLNVHFKGQHSRAVPRWVRGVFLEFLARVLLMKERTTSVHPQTQVAPGDLGHNTHSDIDFKKPMSNGIPNGRPHMLAHPNLEDKLQDLDLSPTLTEFSPVAGVLRKQLHELQKINEFNDSKERQGNVESDWMKVARVLDRLFLAMFLVLQLSITLGVLLKVAT
ncbi:neuronal acetylcholine receptor subunit alpha-10-like [Gigantopelta aegis]|uniref:neuronal acetylcholine receptor subunit alpha-10-like n=1 Tax=Gigantopelta aegis TaxID=1735272 RepID=UPI001B889E79|nr:neuronal acetylcholine receptor subunit alpha-10-like [Gigantopelta aegis]